MIILRNRLIILSVLILTILASCRNELEIMAPYRDIPVVYCVLNPKDSVHFLRLEKSFLGPASALVMARETDSIYYPEAQVVLERWSDGKLSESIPMERIIAPVREEGVFTHDPNILYRTASPVKAGAEYHLTIHVPSTGAEITATTKTLSDFKVIRPEGFKKNLPFSSYDNYQLVEWITVPYARIYHLSIRFHYLEVTGLDTTRLTADWNIGDYLSDDGSGGEVMKVEILQRNFYKWLGNKLDKPDLYTIRLADKKAIDFIFSVGSEDLYTYLEVYRDDSGPPVEKPVFTNITNGIGLFSSRNHQSVNGKSLSEHSIDSLAYGIYTKHLGFGDSQNEYYFTGF